MTQVGKAVCGAPARSRGNRPCQAPPVSKGGVTVQRCKIHGGFQQLEAELARRARGEPPRHGRQAAPPTPPLAGPEGAAVPEVPRTLEELVTGARYAALSASPLQRAIVRLAEGRDAGDISDDELDRYLGSTAWRCPLAPPRGVCLVAGVRGGKSRLAVCAAIWGALTADLSTVETYEEVLAVIVGPTVRQAKKTFKQLLGVLRRPGLAGFIIGEPTVDTVRIRRPDGREVSLAVLPAAAGGESVAGGWLAGLVIEEAASWRSEDDGAAIAAEDTLGVASTRLLPGASKWVISSPKAPSGLLHETWRRYFGPPKDVDEDGTIPWLVVHCPTRALNPSYPQAKIDALRRHDPDKAAREHDAAWTSAVDAWIPHEWVSRATRTAPVVRLRERGCTYVAAMDPATRGNGWCLVVGTRRRCEDGIARMSVVLAHEWRGSQSEPLDPAQVLRELAARVLPYGVTHVLTDQWAADPLRALSRELNTGVMLTERAAQGEDLRELNEALRLAVALHDIEIAPEPTELARDLKGARRVLTPAGIRIEWAKTPDGRHGDFGPALARCVRGLRGVEAPAGPPPPAGSAEARRREEQELEDAEDEAVSRDWRASRAWRQHRRIAR